MVRVGVVADPEQWSDCSYVEIRHPKVRFGIIDYQRLMELMGVGSREQLQQACSDQVEVAIKEKQFQRQCQWSKSLAVGSLTYVEAI